MKQEKEVLIMLQSYTYEFKKKIVRLHVEEGRSYKSITEEYGVSKTSQSKWCREFSKKGQTKAEATPEEPNEMDLMKENRRLRKELEESQKEVEFLKKSSGILCKGNWLETDRFLNAYGEEFCISRFIRRFNIY